MCGLIGALVTPDEHIERRIEAGLVALRHRGPDHHDYRVFRLAGRAVWLGFTRLSIIDLSDDANQPMCSENGRYTLIFNGEIYNYIELRDELRSAGVVFHTTSDTEVLLKAWMQWGESCLERLDGMFAFVMLDILAGTLTCARDPFGIKPFFYSLEGGNFYFASEVPAILDLLPGRPAPDLQRAYDYLVHGDYDSTEHTFVEGVRHLMPSHVLTLDVAAASVRSLRKWWAPNIEQTSKFSFDDAAEAVREQFLQNIRRQLRSDVPLGAALSGGIDSSAVVCAIRYLEPDLPIHTFSYVASETAISEERWVDLVNQHVGAIPHKVRTSAEDLARDIDDLVRTQGEPFGSTSIYAQYRVFKLAHESGITVTLDGQGADELLAGYSGYPGLRAMSLFETGQIGDAMRFVRSWGQSHGAGKKQIAAALARSLCPDRIYQSLHRLAGRSVCPTWLNRRALREGGVQCAWPGVPHVADNQGRRLVEFLAASLQNSGLPSLLRHGDRNSMHFSIESRVPFLTLDLCRLLYSLPEDYLLSRQGETKHVFRAAMRGIVPDAVLNRHDKIGFATPEQRWVTLLAPQCRKWLATAENVPFIHVGKLLGQFDAMVAGRTKFSWQAWRWVNYVRWYNSGLIQNVTNTPACTPELGGVA